MRTCEQNVVRLIRIASLGVVVVFGLCVSPGMVAAMPDHRDVELTVAAMWSMVKPFHALRYWLHGLVAACGPIGPVAPLL